MGKLQLSLFINVSGIPGVNELVLSFLNSLGQMEEDVFYDYLQMLNGVKYRLYLIKLLCSHDVFILETPIKSCKLIHFLFKRVFTKHLYTNRYKLPSIPALTYANS